MTDDQIETKIKGLIHVERQTVSEILALINLAEARDLPLKRGHSGTFDWLTRGLGYLAASAYRRMQSARLIKAVPTAGSDLKAGKLNLSTLTQAQRAIRTSEKVAGRPMASKQKAELVEALRGQTSDEAEITLLKLLPETASAIHQERTKQITEDQTRLFFNFNKEAMEDLAWVTDYLSHLVPDGSHGKILATVLKHFRARAVKKISVKARRERCTFKDENTGRQCESTFMIETDHILPKALGGTDEVRNLRCLCRNHNQMMAREMLGQQWALAYRRKNSNTPRTDLTDHYRVELIASSSGSSRPAPLSRESAAKSDTLLESTPVWRRDFVEPSLI